MLLFVSFGMRAQEPAVVVDSVSVAQKFIELGDISEESEKLGQELLKLKSALDDNTRVFEIDSIITLKKPHILKLVDTVLFKRDDITLRDLKVRKVEWSNYKTVLDEHQNAIKDRSEEISKIVNQVFSDLNKWELTKKELANRSESEDMQESLNRAISSLREVLKAAHLRLDDVFKVQKKITELILVIDQEISNIEVAENQRRKDYFVFDEKPIWKQADMMALSDSLAFQTPSSYQLLVSGVKRNKNQFVEFFRLNMKTAILQIVFLVLLWVFLLTANKKWNKEEILSLKNPVEIQAKTILVNPILTTLSAGMLISAFFYDSMVPAYAEFHILVILLTTVLLLPKLTNKRISTFLWLLFIVYIINVFEAFIGSKAYLLRNLAMFISLLLVTSLYIGRKTVKEHPKNFSQIIRPFNMISILFMALLIIAVIANIIGMFALSNYLTRAVLISVVFAFVVYLSTKVFISLVILVFKFRTNTSIQTLSSLVNATHRRIRPLFNLIGFLVWMVFTLKGFELYDYILNRYYEIIAVEWQIGEMTISLGGMLAFGGIFVMALILSKLAAAIFQDEWMVNVLPRGLAPAVSLVLRIVVIAIGLYAGFTAAGVDLSKLGFIIGALGVGIGFGLQNVVLNFVSGLILAFERPVNIGDTIEVDMEMGVVTNIGVRSSNIRAYSGAEVIIPNGDLISKKVVNWTLSNRNRRSNVAMKTSANADPERVIELFNKIAKDQPNTSAYPEPTTYFHGYDPDGNLSFSLMYWTTFSDTLNTDNDIALEIFKKLKEEGIDAPAPVRRVISEERKQG
ncbi:mechanosensitive ion channel family protein [Cognatitamlana onchidii]|uniref:mechanosensitive ion channel family protein n=1 Tax=Cognatitamlana onchidii TaxID=2562860 RepID=UPI001F435DB0|nr:mechanosensitive ion channel domain-containing protein [Algibacter onchidii]